MFAIWWKYSCTCVGKFIRMGSKNSMTDSNFTHCDICFNVLPVDIQQKQFISISQKERKTKDWLVSVVYDHPTLQKLQRFKVLKGNLTDGLSIIVESLRVIFLAVECISLLFEAFSLTGERRNRNQCQVLISCRCGWVWVCPNLPDFGVLHQVLGQQRRVHTVLTGPVPNIAVKFTCFSPVIPAECQKVNQRYSQKEEEVNELHFVGRSL